MLPERVSVPVPPITKEPLVRLPFRVTAPLPVSLNAPVRLSVLAIVRFPVPTSAKLVAVIVPVPLKVRDVGTLETVIWLAVTPPETTVTVPFEEKVTLSLVTKLVDAAPPKEVAQLVEV